MITTVRVTNGRAIVLGRKINEQSEERFVLNLPKRLQAQPFNKSVNAYAAMCVEYLRQFGFGLLEINVETRENSGEDE